MAAKRAPKTAKSQRVFGQRQESAKMFRVGLYARVSTHDQQTLPLQMRAMHEYAARLGWTVAAQIKEVGSGAAERELRGETDRCRPPPGDRCCACWAVGSLGPVTR
jgi:predicted site-specific integrase-resolvase